MLNFLKKLDFSILGIIVLIACIGFLMLYAAANGSMFPWGIKQILRFSLGLFLLFIIAATDSRKLMNGAYIFYAISFTLLLGVELMGYVGKGGQRWIDLYIFNLQPSELMKIALILALARYFHTKTYECVGSLKTLFIPLLMLLAPVALVLKQPDLGTAMMLLMSGGALFFLTGVRLWKFGVVLVTVLVSFPFIWSRLHTYQQNRILIFLDPDLDPSKTGYHVSQSKIALGSGGVFGKGFMQGTQSHLDFLPEKQTDFIFTMFAEEFGLVGCVILLSLYGIIIAYGYVVAFQSRSHFGKLLALGMSNMLFLYVFINTGMVMGLLPVVGVPLPLMSYGGTAMLTLMMGLGMIFSVKIHQDNRLGRF